VLHFTPEFTGMYDAVNKGFLQAKGEFLAYLNCDEQYLPGTLAYVKDFFNSHPDVDILFGGTLLVRPDCSLIAYRKAYQPRWPYIWVSHLYVLSCAMFVRRRVIEKSPLFDDSLKDIADSTFVIRCLRGGCRAAYAKRYFSSFAMTGSNMSAGENAKREKRELLKSTPRWIRLFWHLINAMRLTEKIFAGAYWEDFPLVYALYSSDTLDVRKELIAEKASFRWKTE